MDTSYKINTRRIGTAHERQAETFLKEKGYRIVARNYRCRSGEIDLIAGTGNVWCSWRCATGRTPEKGIRWRQWTRGNSARICKVSDVYRYHNHIGTDEPVRYDVVAVLGDELVHLENAFPYLGASAY